MVVILSIKMWVNQCPTTSRLIESSINHLSAVSTTQSLQTGQPSFTWQGKVIDGEKVGRTIGFPTANLDRVPDKNQLKPGVYLGNCQINSPLIQDLPEQAGETSLIEVFNKSFSCLAYFGPRLIFGQTANVFEVFIFDFDKSIYDQNLQVVLFQFIRHPIKFSTIEDLKTQLALDLKTAQALLKTNF